MKHVLKQLKLKRKPTVVIMASLLLVGSLMLYVIATRDSLTEQEAERFSENAEAEVRGITPRQIVIPSIGISADIVPVGIDKQGNMAVPEELLEVGWYEPGFKPGEMGSAVFAGHVNSRFGLPTIFQNLDAIELDDTLSITGENDQELVFKVVAKNIYDFRTAPLEEIYGPHDVPIITLITCDDGLWLDEAGTYKDRLVVTAVLVSDETDE